MEIDEWWPRLEPSSRAWLIAHNGEAISPDVLAAITAAGGFVEPSTWWVGHHTSDEFFLSDAAVDWVEAQANGEQT